MGIGAALRRCQAGIRLSRRSFSTFYPRWTAEEVLKKHGLTTNWLEKQRLTMYDYNDTLFSRRLGFKRREIRLLYIIPTTNPSSTVEMVMAHCSLDAHPPYEALSYTGGDPGLNISSTVPQNVLADWWDERFTVMVNDIEFKVKRNLMEALLRFRKTHEGKAIWIDSICINEADPVERTEQIRLMCEVYGNATDVPIWLGERADGVETALSLVNDIVEEFKIWYDQNHSFGLDWNRILKEAEATPDALDQKQFWEWLQSDACKSFFDGIDLSTRNIRTDDIARHFLRALLSRRWFDRVWTWQEKELAKNATVYIGEHTLPWAKLRFAMLLVMAHDLSETRVTPTVLMPGREYLHVLDSLGIARSPDLLDMMQNVRHRETQLPRDKIFGILGAAERYQHPINEDVEHFLRLVNYGYLKTADLYKEFSRYWILEKRDLRVLQDCNPSKKRIRELPSWVVDWSDTTPSQQLSSRLYNATKDTKVGVKYHYHLNQNEIRLDGVAIDTVSFVFQDKRIEESEQHLSRRAIDIRQIPTWRHRLVEPLSSVYVAGVDRKYGNLLRPPIRETFYSLNWDKAYQPTGQSMGEAFWRTLLADQNPYLTNATDRRIDKDMDISSVFHRWAYRKALHRSLLPGSMRDRQEEDVAKWRWIEALEMSLLYKRLFITKAGRIGLAPQNIQTGDIVCALFGGKVLFSLRKQSEWFNLVDETYLHGFMDGEVMDLVNKGALSRDTFCIR